MTDQTDDCGCCAGIDAETPKHIVNRAALPAIRYRVGTHPEFKESMLARLSSTDFKALAKFTARDDADFGIALCDATAMVLDVLSFYQERIANENFLRTAQERRSILELAQLIGYKLAPGVAAATHLAFTMQEAPGIPGGGVEPVTIAIGTRVQSVPGPDEQAQSFETVEAVEARTEWNAIPAQTNLAWLPARGDTELYLAGVATGLQVGDAILIVGQERINDPGSERWDIRVLSGVEPDTAQGRTRIAWLDGLGHSVPIISPATEAPKVYVFHQRAALFGYNAPDPRLLTIPASSSLSLMVEGTGIELKWKSYAINGVNVDLDAAYPKIVAGSWFALVSNETGVGSAALPGYVELYRADSVAGISRTEFGLSGKITRIKPDTQEHFDTRFTITKTLVLAQSELLATAARPLLYPLHGSSLTLGSLQTDLTPSRTLSVSGKRQRIVLAERAKNLAFLLDSGAEVALKPGDSLHLESPPEKLVGGAAYALTPTEFGAVLGSATQKLRLRLRDRDAHLGTLDVQADLIRLQASSKEDETLSEIVLIGAADTAVEHDRDNTTLLLSAALVHVYERASVRINANVARATQGETVSETIGTGNAATSNQTFQLRQYPLTYVSAATPSGRAATLDLRVNDLLWREVPSLFGQKASDKVYALRTDDAGRSRVLFGDGIEGARLPSGQDNLRARYRKGLGVAGNIDAGKLSNLLSRPQGVSGVTNPAPASGGQDAESGATARANAPLTVLTLDRAVSVQDYQDFSRSFAGIAKAHAAWIAAGPGRGVFISVAGEAGAAMMEGSDTYRHLLAALRQYGDVLLPLRLKSYRPATFKLQATLKVAADADASLVLAQADTALRQAFGFNARQFGQMVSVDEVVSVLHAVSSVEAVNVQSLYRPDEGGVARFEPRLFARLPEASLGAQPNAAELLLLDTGPIELEEMA